MQQFLFSSLGFDLKVPITQHTFFVFYRLGETCSHVAAMLYKVEAAVRIGMTKNAPTDLPCQWNQTFTKSIVGSPVAQINVYSDTAKKHFLSAPQQKSPHEPSLDEKTEFLHKLYEVQPKTVALHLFAEFDDKFICKESAKVSKLPPSLR